ncbi:MAG: energy-coupling factor transporter ATPase [Desulfotomaculum sp.]|nr:energy-coupling factor transporter ATPase [Desulfotomaculum sp.]MCL0080767.1 energy-coupling factor transporter ATPase [Peptococcaceae bacterium]
MQDTKAGNESLIELQNVNHAYEIGYQKSIKALSDLNLKIRMGEFIAVIGANGSGKSTFAQHLNALLLPDSGKVIVDGLDTANPDNTWAVRKRVGIVFQNPDNQLVAAIAEEDVAFGPENLGLPPVEIRQRVAYYLKLLDLTAQQKRPPHLLSGGQKQRLVIAGVLAMQPQCLVLDEPTAMLDPSGRQQLLQTIVKLNRENRMTVVLITHLMEEAALADRLVVLHQGTVAMDDTPRQIFTQKAQLEKYGLQLPGLAEMALKLAAVGLYNQKRIPLYIDELVDNLCGL